MKKKYYKVLFFLLISFTLQSTSYAINYDGGTFGAVFKNKGGAGYYSSGKAISMFSEDYIYYNAAGLVFDKRNFINATYSKLFDIVDGIDQKELAGSYHFDNISIGFAFTNIAADDLRKYDDAGNNKGSFNTSFNNLTLGASKIIKKNISLGITFDYYNQKIDNYKLDNYTLGFGGICKINNLQLSLNFNNAFSTKNAGRKYKEKFPLLVSLGCQYYFWDMFCVGVTAIKEEDRKYDYKLGLRYELFKSLWLQGGYLTESETLTAGFMLHWKTIDLQYVYIKHPDLSMSQKLTIGFYNF